MGRIYKSAFKYQRVQVVSINRGAIFTNSHGPDLEVGLKASTAVNSSFHISASSVQFVQFVHHLKIDTLDSGRWFLVYVQQGLLKYIGVYLI